MIEFILPAALAGILIAILAGPLGCFLVWRRMAFFGDSLSHGLILGVAVSLILNLDFSWSVALMGAIIALGLAWYNQQKRLSTDTLLGLFSNGTLALGILLIGMTNPGKLNLMGLLFGDILAVGYKDLIWITLGVIFLLLFLLIFWRNFLKISLDADYAAVEGLYTQLFEIIFMLMVAFFVTLSLKLIGALLINALLIIPAAAARSLGNTPLKMAGGASIIGFLSVIIGMGFALNYDAPPGPAVVLMAVLFFLLTSAINWKR